MNKSHKPDDEDINNHPLIIPNLLTLINLELWSTRWYCFGNASHVRNVNNIEGFDLFLLIYGSYSLQACSFYSFHCFLRIFLMLIFQDINPEKTHEQNP